MTTTRARSSRHRVPRTVATAAVAALALTACGSTDPDRDDAPTGERVEGVTSYGTAAGTVDTLNWALPTGEPTTLNPPNTASYSASLVAMQMCEPLLRINEDYSISPLLGDMAQPDPLTMVFTLRNDVTFWDGTPLTADDVVWSLDYSRAPSSVVSFLYANVVSIEATAADEVTIRLSQADNLLPYTLASFSGGVQEQAFSEAAGESLGAPGTGVMCTGPMRFGDWESGQRITLDRNADYWDADAAANTDEIVFSFPSDSASLAQALTSGELDGAYEVPPAVIPNLQSSSNGQVVFGAPAPLSLAVNVLSTDGPLNSAEVRQAFWSSIDRSAIASVYNGAAAPNYAFTPRDAWDNAAWSDEAKQVFQDHYDSVQADQAEFGSAAAAEQARSAAAAAGYTGEPIVLQILAGDATQSQVAQIIQAQAQAAGFDVQIQQDQPIDFANAAVDPAARQGLDLSLGVSFSVAPNPLETLQFVVSSGSVYNYTGFSDPDVDEAIATAYSDPDQVVQAQALVQAERSYGNQYLSQTLLQLNEVAYVSDDLGGVMASFPYLNNPSVARIGSAG